MFSPRESSTPLSMLHACDVINLSSVNAWLHPSSYLNTNAPPVSSHPSLSSTLSDLIHQSHDDLVYFRHERNIAHYTIITHIMSLFPKEAWMMMEEKKKKEEELNDENITASDSDLVPLQLILNYACVPALHYAIIHHPTLVTQALLTYKHRTNYVIPQAQLAYFKHIDPYTHVIMDLNKAMDDDIIVTAQKKVVHVDDITIMDAISHTLTSTLEDTKQSCVPVICASTCMEMLLSHGIFPFPVPPPLISATSISAHRSSPYDTLPGYLDLIHLITWSDHYHTTWNDAYYPNKSFRICPESVVSVWRGLTAFARQWNPERVQQQRQITTSTLDTLLIPDVIIQLVLSYDPIPSCMIHIHNCLSAWRTVPELCHELHYSIYHVLEGRNFRAGAAPSHSQPKTTFTLNNHKKCHIM